MRTTGVVACLLALAACSHSSNSSAVSLPAAQSAAPTSGPTTSAAAPATSPPAAAPTSAGPRTPGFDVDGDGTADKVSARFLDKRRAVLDVRLGNGKSLTSKPFRLYAGEGAGKVSGFDVDGDRRSEVFVEAPGGDGIGYDLFQWVGSSLVAVPAPKGQQAPYLYIGGGRYYESTFRCTGRTLVQLKEAPAVASTAQLPQDPPFRVTVTTYHLLEGKLSVVSTRTVRARDRAASQALLADPSDGCGTKP